MTVSSVAVFSNHLCIMSITSTQYLVRGGIRVAGNFEYKIEPEACVKVDIVNEPVEEGSGDVGSGDVTIFIPRITVSYCTGVYDSWPNNYVDLYAYYQTRRFKGKWPVSLRIHDIVHMTACRQKAWI